MLINAAIVFCRESHRGWGAQASLRHLFLSLWGFKPQILLCHTALQLVTDPVTPAEISLAYFQRRLGKRNNAH